MDMQPGSHVGKIFELGPDGFGYILDKTEPGRSYVFQLHDIEGLNQMRYPWVGLEGETVTFRIAPDGLASEIVLVRKA